MYNLMIDSFWRTAYWLDRLFRRRKPARPTCEGLGIHEDHDMLVALASGLLDAPFKVKTVLDHCDVCDQCAGKLRVVVALRATMPDLDATIAVINRRIRRDIHELGE